MNATRIITILCWIISAVVLIGLLVWFLAGSVFSGWGILQDVNIFGINIGITENLTGTYEVQTVHTESTNGLGSMHIAWVAGEITVTPYDGDEIKITESAQRTLRANEKMHIRNQNGTLRIEFRDRGINRGRMPRKLLEVLVPHAFAENITNLTINTTSGAVDVSNLKVTTLNLNSVSSKFDVSEVTANNADISTTSGAITVRTMTAGKLSASTVSGAVSVINGAIPVMNISTTSGATSMDGEFDNIDTSTVSGALIIKSSKTPSRINTSSVSGGTQIYIPSTETITVSHSAVSGRFSSDVPVTMQSNGAYSFSSVSGSTHIYILGD